jgi:preprotein translocase subunit SecG
MGGTSAFGAKAGDIFTRITVVAAAIWIVLCIAATKITPSSAGGRLDVDAGGPASSAPLLPGTDQEKEGDTNSAPADSSAPASSESTAAPAEEAAPPSSDASGAAPAEESKSE